VGAPPRKTIGSFEVEETLGEGGMGVVYLARQPDLDRLVVLKALRRELADDARAEERFVREAQAAASVQHQNVVTVYDCFEWRGDRYIAQEYVEGANLASILAKVGRVAPRVATLVALEISRGLEEIHARGIVHRDLKPSNILLGRAGETKIADFGIAFDARAPALTRSGHTVGTPTYMSPEQLVGDRVDPRSDLFALGVVFYEMLTGEPPFVDGESQQGEGLLRRIEAGSYRGVRRRAPRTSRSVARLVHRCLRARARRRPQTAAEVRRTLERSLGAPAPAECRRAIAAWLWERKAFGSSGGDATEARPPLLPRPRMGVLRWALAIASGLVLAFWLVAKGHVEVQSVPILGPLLAAAQPGGDPPAARPERSGR
jgi:serine/threonine-protein kinase